MKGRWLTWAPLAVFMALALLFAGRLLWPEEHVIPSRMVGKPLPAFSLPAAASDRPALDSRQFAAGKPRLLNIFASWCVPCAAEAPQLMALRRAGVPIDGIAIRDARADVDRFLARHGNPFEHIGLDARSSVQLALTLLRAFAIRMLRRVDCTVSPVTFLPDEIKEQFNRVFLLLEVMNL